MSPTVPLPSGMVYHFNVIYNHARCPLGETDDTDLALDITRWIVDSLENVGLVNSYYHHRDFRDNLTLAEELDRVLSLSEMTIIILTPGFLKDCLYQYTHINAFKSLLDGQRNRVLVLQFCDDDMSVTPAALWGHEVIRYNSTQDPDGALFWCKFYSSVGVLLALQQGCHRKDQRQMVIYSEMVVSRNKLDTDNYRSRSLPRFQEKDKSHRYQSLSLLKHQPSEIPQHDTFRIKNQYYTTFNDGVHFDQFDLLPSKSQTEFTTSIDSISLEDDEEEIQRKLRLQYPPLLNNSLLENSNAYSLPSSLSPGDSDVEFLDLNLNTSHDHQNINVNAIINEKFSLEDDDNSSIQHDLKTWEILTDLDHGCLKVDNAGGQLNLKRKTKSTRQIYQRKYEKLMKYMDDNNDTHKTDESNSSSEQDESIQSDDSSQDGISSLEQNQSEQHGDVSDGDKIKHNGKVPDNGNTKRQMDYFPENHPMKTESGISWVRELDEVDPEYGWYEHSKAEQQKVYVIDEGPKSSDTELRTPRMQNDDLKRMLNHGNGTQRIENIPSKQQKAYVVNEGKHSYYEDELATPRMRNEELKQMLNYHISHKNEESIACYTRNEASDETELRTPRMRNDELKRMLNGHIGSQCQESIVDKQPKADVVNKEHNNSSEKELRTPRMCNDDLKEMLRQQATNTNGWSYSCRERNDIDDNFNLNSRYDAVDFSSCYCYPADDRTEYRDDLKPALTSDFENEQENRATLQSNYAAVSWNGNCHNTPNTHHDDNLHTLCDKHPHYNDTHYNTGDLYYYDACAIQTTKNTAIHNQQPNYESHNANLYKPTITHERKQINYRSKQGKYAGDIKYDENLQTFYVANSQMKSSSSLPSNNFRVDYRDHSINVKTTSYYDKTPSVDYTNAYTTHNQRESIELIGSSNYSEHYSYKSLGDAETHHRDYETREIRSNPSYYKAVEHQIPSTTNHYGYKENSHQNSINDSNSIRISSYKKENFTPKSTTDNRYDKHKHKPLVNHNIPSNNAHSLQERDSYKAYPKVSFKDDYHITKYETNDGDVVDFYPQSRSSIITRAQKPTSITSNAARPTNAQKPASTSRAATNAQKPASTSRATTNAQKPASTSHATTDAQKPASTSSTTTNTQKSSSTPNATTKAPKPTKERTPFHLDLDSSNDSNSLSPNQTPRNTTNEQNLESNAPPTYNTEDLMLRYRLQAPNHHSNLENFQNDELHWDIILQSTPNQQTNRENETIRKIPSWNYESDDIKTSEKKVKEIIDVKKVHPTSEDSSRRNKNINDKQLGSISNQTSTILRTNESVGVSASNNNHHILNSYTGNQKVDYENLESIHNTDTVRLDNSEKYHQTLVPESSPKENSSVAKIETNNPALSYYANMNSCDDNMQNEDVYESNSDTFIYNDSDRNSNRNVSELRCPLNQNNSDDSFESGISSIQSNMISDCDSKIDKEQELSCVHDSSDSNDNHSKDMTTQRSIMNPVKDVINNTLPKGKQEANANQSIRQFDNEVNKNVSCFSSVQINNDGDNSLKYNTEKSTSIETESSVDDKLDKNVVECISNKTKTLSEISTQETSSLPPCGSSSSRLQSEVSENMGKNLLNADHHSENEDQIAIVTDGNHQAIEEVENMMETSDHDDLPSQESQLNIVLEKSKQETMKDQLSSMENRLNHISQDITNVAKDVDSQLDSNHEPVKKLQISEKHQLEQITNHPQLDSNSDTTQQGHISEKRQSEEIIDPHNERDNRQNCPNDIADHLINNKIKANKMSVDVIGTGMRSSLESESTREIQSEDYQRESNSPIYRIENTQESQSINTDDEHSFYQIVSSDESDTHVPIAKEIEQQEERELDNNLATNFQNQQNIVIVASDEEAMQKNDQISENHQIHAIDQENSAQYENMAHISKTNDSLVHIETTETSIASSEDQLNTINNKEYKIQELKVDKIMSSCGDSSYHERNIYRNNEHVKTNQEKLPSKIEVTNDTTEVHNDKHTNNRQSLDQINSETNTIDVVDSNHEIKETTNDENPVQTQPNEESDLYENSTSKSENLSIDSIHDSEKVNNSEITDKHPYTELSPTSYSEISHQNEPEKGFINEFIKTSSLNVIVESENNNIVASNLSDVIKDSLINDERDSESINIITQDNIGIHFINEFIKTSATESTGNENYILSDLIEDSLKMTDSTGESNSENITAIQDKCETQFITKFIKTSSMNESTGFENNNTAAAILSEAIEEASINSDSTTESNSGDTATDQNNCEQQFINDFIKTSSMNESTGWENNNIAAAILSEAIEEASINSDSTTESNSGDTATDQNNCEQQFINDFIKTSSMNENNNVVARNLSDVIKDSLINEDHDEESSSENITTIQDKSESYFLNEFIRTSSTNNTTEYDNNNVVAIILSELIEDTLTSVDSDKVNVLEIITSQDENGERQFINEFIRTSSLNESTGNENNVEAANIGELIKDSLINVNYSKENNSEIIPSSQESDQSLEDISSTQKSFKLSSDVNSLSETEYNTENDTSPQKAKHSLTNCSINSNSTTMLNDCNNLVENTLEPDFLENAESCIISEPESSDDGKEKDIIEPISKPTDTLLDDNISSLDNVVNTTGNINLLQQYLANEKEGEEEEESTRYNDNNVVATMISEWITKSLMNLDSDEESNSENIHPSNGNCENVIDAQTSFANTGALESDDMIKLRHELNLLEITSLAESDKSNSTNSQSESNQDEEYVETSYLEYQKNNLEQTRSSQEVEHNLEDNVMSISFTMNRNDGYYNGDDDCESNHLKSKLNESEHEHNNHNKKVIIEEITTGNQNDNSVTQEIQDEEIIIVTANSINNDDGEIKETNEIDLQKEADDNKLDISSSVKSQMEYLDNREESSCVDLMKSPTVITTTTINSDTAEENQTQRIDGSVDVDTDTTYESLEQYQLREDAKNAAATSMSLKTTIKTKNDITKENQEQFVDSSVDDGADTESINQYQPYQLTTNVTASSVSLKTTINTNNNLTKENQKQLNNSSSVDGCADTDNVSESKKQYQFITNATTSDSMCNISTEPTINYDDDQIAYLMSIGMIAHDGRMAGRKESDVGLVGNLNDFPEHLVAKNSPNHALKSPLTVLPDLHLNEILPVQDVHKQLHTQAISDQKKNTSNMSDDTVITSIQNKSTEAESAKEYINEYKFNATHQTELTERAIASDNNYITIEQDRQLDLAPIILKDPTIHKKSILVLENTSSNPIVFSNTTTDSTKLDLDLPQTLVYKTDLSHHQKSEDMLIFREDMRFHRALVCERLPSLEKCNTTTGYVKQTKPLPWLRQLSSSSSKTNNSVQWTKAQVMRKKRRGTNVDGFTSSSSSSASSSSSSDEEQTNWTTSVYKGIYHTYTQPDMPFLG